jgi:hypothetical protein
VLFGDLTRTGQGAATSLVTEAGVEEHNLAATEVLVVGDSAESELRVGRELGMVTVQVLRDGVDR